MPGSLGGAEIWSCRVLHILIIATVILLIPPTVAVAAAFIKLILLG